MNNWPQRLRGDHGDDHTVRGIVFQHQHHLPSFTAGEQCSQREGSRRLSSTNEFVKAPSDVQREIVTSETRLRRRRHRRRFARVSLVVSVASRAELHNRCRLSVSHYQLALRRDALCHAACSSSSAASRLQLVLSETESSAGRCRARAVAGPGPLPGGGADGPTATTVGKSETFHRSFQGFWGIWWAIGLLALRRALCARS